MICLFWVSLFPTNAFRHFLGDLGVMRSKWNYVFLETDTVWQEIAVTCTIRALCWVYLNPNHMTAGVLMIFIILMLYSFKCINARFEKKVNIINILVLLIWSFLELMFLQDVGWNANKTLVQTMRVTISLCSLIFLFVCIFLIFVDIF